MMNRTPITGMQPRSNQHGGRSGSVHYGRNPGGRAGGFGGENAGAQPRRDMHQPHAQPSPDARPAAPESAESSKAPEAGSDQQYIKGIAPSGPSAGTHDDAAPEALKNPIFLPGQLRTWIGKTIRAEFLIGTNIIEERTGELTDVGANYIVLNEAETRNRVLCDIHSIKFITAVEDIY